VNGRTRKKPNTRQAINCTHSACCCFKGEPPLGTGVFTPHTVTAGSSFNEVHVPSVAPKGRPILGMPWKGSNRAEWGVGKYVYLLGSNLDRGKQRAGRGRMMDAVIPGRDIPAKPDTSSSVEGQVIPLSAGFLGIFWF